MLKKILKTMSVNTTVLDSTVGAAGLGYKVSTAGLEYKLQNADNIRNYITDNETELDDKNFYTLLNPSL